MSWRLLPSGERAILAEGADLAAVLALNDTLASLIAGGDAPWSAVVDRVPAARTLLVTVTDPAALPPLVDALGSVCAALEVRDAAFGANGPAARQDADAPIEIPVVYDGPDLDEVAALTGLSPAAVVAAHTGTPWRAGFAGFAPGFTYLVDGDARLAVPRRPVPRPRVNAGAVGLAGQFSGIYPRPSPGGWRLIGHTSAILWEATRTPPALITPGSWVRFVAVDGR